MGDHTVNEGDSVTVEDEYVGDTFEAEIREITDDGEVIAELGEDAPGDTGQSVELTSEPDWSVEDVQEPASQPEDIDVGELSLFDVFEMQTPQSGTKEFEVVGGGEEPDEPREILSEDGENRYLMWPDGELEEV